MPARRRLETLVRRINPATEEPLEEIKYHSATEIEGRLQLAAKAFKSWRTTSLEERAIRMRRVASLLRERLPQLSKLMAVEMGKPVLGGDAEIEKCAGCCEYFADHAAEF